MKALQRIAVTGLALLVVGAAAGAWLLHTQQRAMERPLHIGSEPFVYVVHSGATIADVARDLQGAGLIGSARRLELQARWPCLVHRIGAAVDGAVRGLEAAGWIDPALRPDLQARWPCAARRIKAGEYALEPGLTPAGLLDLLVAGTVIQYPFAIIEGWTFRELRRRIAETDTIVHTLDGLSDEQVMARLGFAGLHPEGRFFPETYHFPAGTTDAQLLRRSFDAMSAYLESAWARRAPDLPLSSPEEALVLASIVEKETGVAEERPRIAGVFTSRLRRGMRLETDPTVIYGLGSEFDGDLKKTHLKRDGPYNTYRRKGLPPTPIAMAGAAAIDAAVAPVEDGSLYFVATGDGRHAFSTNYGDHRKAVRRYQGPGRRSKRAAEAEKEQ